jgi:drug/metabolite transporter (DMT)-like permease
MLINSFLNAVNFNLLRMMKDIHYAIAPFYYGVFGSFVSLCFIMHDVIYSLEDTPGLGTNDYILFALIGGTSALGAIFKSVAFHYEKVTTLSLIKYTNLIYSLAADYFLFNSVIYPGEIVGASMILFSNVIVAFMKMKSILT